MKTRLAILLLLLVAAAPLPADQHPHLAKGFDPNKVYHFTGIDSINAFNGNLTVTIPIGQEYSIGGGLTYQLHVIANGKVWDHEERLDLENAQVHCGKPFETTSPPCISAFPNRRSNAGLGWTLSLGRLFPSLEQTNASSAWEYETPDGSVHRFYTKFNNTYTHAGVQYTNDGSYLRLVKDGTRYKIEFPNGEVHTFMPDDDATTDEDDANVELAPWLLEHIGNKFNPEALTVHYTRSGGVITGWTITDGWRSHTVSFEQLPFESGLDDIPLDEPEWGTAQKRMLVKTVTLAAFNQTTAQYTFQYTPDTIGRPAWDTIPGTYNDTRASVQLLSSLGLPDGTSYSFAYHRDGLSGLGGCLREMVLPTRGKIAWDWGSYSFPERGESSENPVSADRQPGISIRRTYAQDGTLIGTWTYESSAQAIGDPPQVPKWMKTVITSPDGSRTDNYFDTSSGDSTHSTYGLPYNTLVRDATSNRFLSQRFWAKGADAVLWPVRETYVRYELDPGTTESHRNARVASTRTKYDAGLNLDVNDDETVDVDRDQFDGYGHYRVVKETVDAGKATQQSRTTTTTFNPAVGVFPSASFDPLTPLDDWLTETFDSVTKSDGNGTETTSISFDPEKGVLLSTRKSRKTDRCKDLLTVMRYNDATGELEREQYFGGDFGTAAFDSNCELRQGAVPEFELVHTNYAGSRASSQYVGVSFKSLDLTIDRNTGLPSSSRDSAGVSTTFLYDASSRLREVRPADAAWTHYAYHPAGGTTVPASVAVTQWAEGSSQAAGKELTHVQYHYDGLGRLVQESRRMPAGWAVTSTRYDALDRRITVYPARYEDSPAYVTARSDIPTRWTYDGEGRVNLIEQPDGSKAKIEYKTGTHATSRGKRTTTKVATNAPGAAAGPETEVVVEEKMDGFGRLVQVKENAGGTAPFVTTYTYDLADHLRTVVMDAQTRTFTYDRAGLLESETHPETDAPTTYLYDSRGHIRTRGAPAGSLSFGYDKAERLTVVSGSAGKLKEFVFDRSNDDRSMGKLDRAVRYNRHPNLAGGLARVEEQFFYAGPGGRASSKVTTVRIGPEAAPVETYEFPESYTYDPLGETSQIAYPGCTEGCDGFNPPLRAVKTDRYLGLPSAVTPSVGGVEGKPYVSGVSYAPGGATTEIRHVNSDGEPGPIYKKEVDAMGRPVRIEVSKFCDDLRTVAISASPEPENLPRGTLVTLTATASNAANQSAFVTSWQWFRRDVTGDHLLDETTNVLEVEAGDVTGYFAKATNDTCSAESAVQMVAACDSAAATISAPERATASEKTRAFVSETPGALYLWSITNGELVGERTLSSVEFIPACSGVVVLTVRVTTACGEVTTPKNVSIDAPRAFVGGSRSVAGGGTYDITVDLDGQGPWTVQWADIGTRTYTASPAVRPVTVTATSTFTVTSATDARGCPLTIATSSATITVDAQCTAPTPSIQFFQPVLASKRDSARSVDVYDSYYWTVANAQIVPSTQTSRVVNFIPGCSGNVVATLTVTNACGASGKVSASIPIDPPSVEILQSSSSLTYVPGEPAPQIEFAFAAAIPELTWSDGLHQSFHSVTNSGQEARTATPSSTTTYKVTALRDANGCIGTVAGQSIVNVCSRPAAQISAPARVVALTANTASVPVTAGATYQWTVTGGTLVSGGTTSSIVFRGVCGIPVKLSVKVKGGGACQTIESTHSVDVAVDPPTATLTGSTTITQGSSTTLTVALSGPGPWKVQWSDIGEQDVSVLPYTLTVKPDSTTTYKLLGMSSSGCTGTVAGEATVTVVLPAPGNVSAEATSGSVVRVQWSYPGIAGEFHVYRNGQVVGEPIASPFDDVGLPAGKAFVYQVVARKGASVSPPSATDLATTAIYPQTVTAGSLITAQDILATRNAVDAVRAAAGLAAFPFTDPSLVGVEAKVAHAIELRTALAAARMALGLPAVAYANEERNRGDGVSARDIIDVRAGMR